MSELQDIEKAVERGMERAFLRMGVDISTPAAVQEVQKDMNFVRSWRQTHENLGNKTRWAILFFFLSGLVALVVTGIRAWTQQ